MAESFLGRSSVYDDDDYDKYNDYDDYDDYNYYDDYMAAPLVLSTWHRLPRKDIIKW